MINVYLFVDFTHTVYIFFLFLHIRYRYRTENGIGIPVRRKSGDERKSRGKNSSAVPATLEKITGAEAESKDRENNRRNCWIYNSILKYFNIND